MKKSLDSWLFLHQPRSSNEKNPSAFRFLNRFKSINAILKSIYHSKVALMKKYFLIPASLLIGSYGYADSYSWSLSADTTRFDYAETADGTLLDTEKADYGKVNGFTISLQPRYNGLYLSASYAKGDTDYAGSLIGSGNPYGSYRAVTTNEIADYDFGYKATARLDSRGDLEMPVTAGVGYRRWLRQLHGTPGVSGYDELYEWGYYDVGVGLHYRLAPDMSLGIDGNYRTAFIGFV